VSVLTPKNADRNSGIAFASTIMAQIIFAVVNAVLEPNQYSFVIGMTIIAFVGSIISGEVYIRSLGQDLWKRPRWLVGQLIVITFIAILLAATFLFDASRAPKFWMIRIGALDLFFLLIVLTVRPFMMTKHQPN
jgi:hypothetical protein